MIEKYGATFGDKATDALIELWMAFDIHPPSTHSLHTASGFLGAFQHLKNGIDLIWNAGKSRHLIWNDWTEGMLRELIENREVSLAGPGGSHKTTCLACYSVCRWFASPLDTRVIITSTTLDGLRARIWKEVIRFYRASQCGFGNPVNHPHPKIQTIKGDDGTGIFGIAVDRGDVDKAVENIKGRHAPNTLVCVDEMTGVSEAIVKAGSNLEKGSRRFQMHGSANPISYFDQHGMFSEPLNGWDSIGVDSERWETKRGGICLHLDGLKAPNVVSGKVVAPGMISLDDIEVSRRRDGEDSPIWWSQVRGFWCPEGIEKTFLTQSLIVKFKAREQPIWVGDYIEGAAFDPAFEGRDRKSLGHWRCGMIDLGAGSWSPNGFEAPKNNYVWAIAFIDRVLLNVNVTLNEPIHYQLARQVSEHLNSWGVQAKHFGMDVTGEGGGVASILKREHNLQGFQEIEFGGGAPTTPFSPLDMRPANQVCLNMVTYLWYRFRRGVELNRVRGLDVDTCKEFCQRQYKLQGKLVVAEPKKEMKLRTGGVSPDLADEAVVAHEMFLRSVPDFALDNQIEGTINPNRNWMDFAKKMMPRNKYGLQKV